MSHNGAKDWNKPCGLGTGLGELRLRVWASAEKITNDDGYQINAGYRFCEEPRRKAIVVRNLGVFVIAQMKMVLPMAAAVGFGALREEEPDGPIGQSVITVLV